MSGRAHKGRVNHERWLVSYADFITLLFSFFVVLYAFAKADQKRQTEVTAAIDTAFKALGVFGDTSHTAAKASKPAGMEQPAAPVSVVSPEQVMSVGRVKDDLNRIRRDLEHRLAPQLAQHSVAIEMGRDGLVISLREAGFFASGSATPQPETLPTLRQIAASLGNSPYDMRVEGHTDNVPMHNTEFDSNWELSSARATHIARLLLDLKTLPPDRLSAAGYAEFHPVASNATEEGRAKNRRVDLVILPRTRINFAEPNSSETSSGNWRKITDE